ncbi:hypothetical protein GAY28_14565 [Azospirillum brasilense]|nr:hypothetical protein [Azospirillum brasilense]
MSENVTRRVALVRGSSSLLATVVGLDGELIVDQDKKTVTVHDGEKLGGYALLREDGDGAAVTVKGRTQNDRAGDIVNVKDSPHSAAGDGVTDDAAAFSSAALVANGAINAPSMFDGFPRAVTKHVYVPPGTYNLASRVDTGGAVVVWLASSGAKFINPENLNGYLCRDGKRVNAFTHGTLDEAGGFSVSVGRELERTAGILGLTSPDQIGAYPDRDSVALYADATAPAPTLTLASASYTATTVVPATPLSADDLKLLRVGMVIDTAHSPKYSGVVTDWAANGTSITVASWHNSSSTTGGTPSGTAAAYVNPITKIWSVNSNTFLFSTSHADRSMGYELGVYNNKAQYDGVTGPDAGGFDCVSLGTYRGRAAYRQRGPFWVGFESRDAAGSGFRVRDGSVQNPAYGFVSEQTSGLPFAIRPGGAATAWAVATDGSMETGRTDLASTVTWDFRTSALNTDFDVRFQFSGGAPTTGGGTATFTAATLNLRVGSVKFLSPDGSEQFRVTNGGAAVNFMAAQGSATGQPVQFQAFGSDADVDIYLRPKGAGVVRFGTWTSNADAAVNGFIYLRDAGGTLRKLATIA